MREFVTWWMGFWKFWSRGLVKKLERGEVCALEIGAESRSREGLFENLSTVIESGGLETEFECP